jgi:polyketide cyclase/dehydrase/lipid transport protein
MPRPYASAVIAASADEVWAVVRLFDGLATWIPTIESSSLDKGVEGQVGAVRRLTVAGAGVVVEDLLAMDDVGRSYTYSFLESPFAVRRYVATIRVAPITDTGQAFVEWWAEFDADEAHEAKLSELFGQGVFAGGLKGLQKHFGG